MCDGQRSDDRFRLNRHLGAGLDGSLSWLERLCCENKLSITNNANK